MVNPIVQLQVVRNPLADVAGMLKRLTKQAVFAGVPAKTTDRKKTAEMTNATLAYIHDNGSPAANIPPRPFMKEGIKNAQKDIERYLGQSAQLASKGKDPLPGFHAAGLAAQKAIRRKIQTGPFTPLKASTLRGRKRKRPSRSNTRITPLIDTGQMLAAINYVVRPEK